MSSWQLVKPTESQAEQGCPTLIQRAASQHPIISSPTNPKHQSVITPEKLSSHAPRHTSDAHLSTSNYQLSNILFPNSTVTTPQ